MWKFQNFSISQILREINFGNSRSAKSAFSTHLEALNFDWYGFLHVLKAEIYQIDKIQMPQNGKMTFSELLHSLKLISRNI